MIRFSHPAVLASLLLLALLVAFELSRMRRHDALRANLPALGLRSAALLLLIIALAGAQAVGPVRGTTAIFLVDLSESVRRRAEGVATESIASMTASMGPSDRAGVIAFGAQSAIEAAVAPEIEVDRFESVIDGSATDIEGAILRGLSSFPESVGRRMVLFSDGRENSGAAAEAAALSARLGVRIDVVPLRESSSAIDAAITAAEAPARVNVGEVFDFSLHLFASAPTDSWLYVVRDGVFLGEDRIALEGGEQVARYSTSLESGGVHQYQFFLEPELDSVPENNEYRITVAVEGTPALLYVANPEEPSSALIAALASQGIPVEEIAVSHFPTSLAGLGRYDAIIFDDVSAFDLSFARMELIERFVRDLAGGFVMLGGESSFGLGGYLNTPIERLLPVSMDVTSSMEIPSLALIMVVDKSGSMGETIASGETKLDLVKEAVIASVEVLNPYYTVGLLSFDADFEWTIEPTRVGERERIVVDLIGLAPGGGTRLYPAMEEAFARIDETRAAVKHLLVLSDGLTDDGEFEELVARIAEKRITVSTIAVGADSDRELLEMIADRGDGRSYFTDDIERIPRIFASESIIVSRGLIVEERFIPQPQISHAILEGIDRYALPPLAGFVLAYAKPAATQVLSAFNDNPLLVVWQYGLGRSVAFTSDLKGRWGRSWVEWEEFPSFAAQLLRWIQRPPGSSALGVELTLSRGEGLLVVDAVDEEGDFRNVLALEALLLLPGGSTETRLLEQIAPGRYVAGFEARLPGDYIAAVYDTASPVAPVTSSASIPYPAEFLPASPDTGLLEEIAAMTGGTIIEPGSEPDLFSAGDSERSYRPLWSLLLIASLALFTADIAWRQCARRGDEEGAPVERRFLRRKEAAPRITYDDAIERIERSYQDEAAKKRDLAYWFGGEARRTNPLRKEAEKRLYLAKRKGR